MHAQKAHNFMIVNMLLHSSSSLSLGTMSANDDMMVLLKLFELKTFIQNIAKDGCSKLNGEERELGPWGHL
jgi:hypothetical protein